jgi:hypothetical protein
MKAALLALILAALAGCAVLHPRVDVGADAAPLWDCGTADAGPSSGGASGGDAGSPGSPGSGEQD